MSTFLKTIILSLLISMAVCLLFLSDLPRTGGFAAAPAKEVSKETTYERVMRTKEIHCGYTSWNPLFYIDPKTNEKLGIFHDMMEEAGKRLGVKIVWQEELGWGTVTESVRNGRVDMACAGYWLNPARIKTTLTSAPQIYSPMYIWMRQDDTRTLNSPDDLNSDQYTAATIDGSADGYILAARFPKTKLITLPELDTNSDMIESVNSKKADFIIFDAGSMVAYIANNPGKIKGMFSNKPMNVFPNVMLLPPEDLRFKDLIDNIMRNIEYDGTLDTILKKYKMDQSFLRNPPPVSPAP